MFARAGPVGPGLDSSIFTVSFPQDGSGRVVITALQPSIPSPIPKTTKVTIKEKEKPLYAFYRSIADSEMGQRWNLWNYLEISCPRLVQYPSESVNRFVYERPFFPNYWKRAPFKFWGCRDRELEKRKVKNKLLLLVFLLMGMILSIDFSQNYFKI